MFATVGRVALAGAALGLACSGAGGGAPGGVRQRNDPVIVEHR